MEMYGKVAVILNQRGWKLEAKLTPKVKVDVTKFSAGNGGKYVHINRNGNTLSLHYEEYEELCLVKEALDRQLSHLDKPIPELTAPKLTVVSIAADSTTISAQPTLASSSPTPLQTSTHVPIPSLSYSSLLPVEGIQYGTTPSPYYPRMNLERGPPPPYQASQRHHPYNKQ